MMDEYHYFLTVEWDQQDKSIFEKRTKEFEDDLDKLIEKGLSYKDLGAIPEELQDLNFQDHETVKESLLNHSKYSQGASWNGEIIGPAIILGITSIAIFAFIRYAVKKNKAFDECVELHGGDEQSCIDR